ncbi:MAG: bifunctional DNA-formamidopyrimidine glycosylase/DNA-(apurinic or apyrimidinic site) lyase [Candidatus Paceibacterota bacterium]|jgi:formamidopyrimidine-DNA glycosylase
MPELPEVQTTVNGLTQTVVGLRIIEAWSDYDSTYWKGSESIRDVEYFVRFRKAILGKKIVAVRRRAKNILIELSNGAKKQPDIILIHMKMTGHLLYGTFEYDGKQSKHRWIPISPESLKDPFNRHIHFVLTFSNKKYMALSDSRKFAKVTFIPASEMENTVHLKGLGPEPLEEAFTFPIFLSRIHLRPKGKIKQVLMEPKIIAGIGNIYADESLWRAGIHPLEKVSDIPDPKLKQLFLAIKKTLARGIDFGGDSMSDYRNIHGEKGRFQEQHSAYRKTGQKCSKLGCKGIIRRVLAGSRSAHYCDVHQRLSKL